MLKDLFMYKIVKQTKETPATARDKVGQKNE